MKLLLPLTLMSLIISGCASSFIAPVENLSGMNPVAMAPLTRKDSLQDRYYRIFTGLKNHLEMIDQKGIQAGLYIPNGYSEKREYPLIVLCAQVSSKSQSIAYVLEKTGGGILFPGLLEENRQDCFVLSIPDQPSLTENWITSQIEEIQERYSIETERIYSFSSNESSAYFENLSHIDPQLFAGLFFLQSDGTSVWPDPQSRFVIVSDQPASDQWVTTYPSAIETTLENFKADLDQRTWWITDTDLAFQEFPLSFENMLRLEKPARWLLRLDKKKLRSRKGIIDAESTGSCYDKAIKRKAFKSDSHLE